VWQVDVNGHDSQPLIQDEAFKADPAWSPDGILIAYRVLEDPYTLPNSTLQVHRHSSLHVASPDGTEEDRLTPQDGYVSAFSWAPDGDQIVISARLEDLNQDNFINHRDRARLYIVDLTSREIRTVIPDVAPELSMHRPAWSSDGEHIAYIEGHGDLEAHGDLVIVKADDGSEVTRLEVAPGGAYSWSPGGEEIAYVKFRVAGRVGYDDLFVFDLSTQDVTCLTDTSLYSVFSAEELNGITLDDPVWSPDGRYVAFVWKVRGKDYIVVVSADGSQLFRIADPGQYHLVAWGR